MHPIDRFKPFVSAQEKQKELSLKAIVLGIILSFFFVVANTFLGLKLGMTISASIPAAILSMMILRTFFKKSTILENNIVQTTASVGEGLATGAVFTLPALFLLDAGPSIGHTFVLSILGGILGILFMIPMRRYIIVKEHGVLPFPEGKACAEILKAGEKSAPSGVLAIWGIIIGAIYKTLGSALHLWKETVQLTIKRYENVVVSIDCTPALMGVGYIIGPRIAAVLFAGGALGWWLLIPLIKEFGTGTNVIYPGTIPIPEMSAEDIWSNYIRYIGAGAIATGGLITLFRVWPVISKTMIESFRELRHLLFSPKRKKVSRTDKDIPLSYLVLGSLAIILALWVFPGFNFNIVTILLLVILGFFFVAVTSITVGLIGSSSNPGSGMTLTTLIIACLIFLGLGWTDRVHMIAAITMGAVANIAIALSAATSQDLKTGFLLGATPRSQQIAELIAICVPALAMGFTIYLLNAAYGFGSTTLPAPQATLMAIIVKGVIQQELPILFVLFGVILGLFVFLLRAPVLPFAIGLYLPISLSTAVMAGGFAHLIVKSFSSNKKAVEQGVLLSSGLVAGDACTGVVIALLSILGATSTSPVGRLPDWVSFVAFIALAAYLVTAASRRYDNKSKA